MKLILPSILFSFTLASPAPAEDTNTASIDSGGGKSFIGAHTIHTSIGSPFATGTVSIGAENLRPGLIEILYPNAELYDSDKNGLPDAWEKEHFGRIGVDPQGNPDGDANTNLLEYLAGTDPNDNKSNFKPEGDHDGVLVYTLPIQTVEKRSYKIYATNDLENWYLQETYVGDGSLKVYSFDELSPVGGLPHSPTHPSKYFFRVQITEVR